MSAPINRRRRRLLLNIYLVGVAQLAVAGIAIFVVQRLLERAPWQLEPARQKALLDGFAEFYDQPDALSRALGKLTDVDLTFYSLDGRLLASTTPPLEPLSATQLDAISRAPLIQIPHAGPMPIIAVPVRRNAALVGYGMVHRHHPDHALKGARSPTPPSPLLPPPSRLPLVIAIALIGAAVISVWFARRLARPLARLAQAAEAFGGGDLSARAGLVRDDELGALARTFDDMADRVNALLLGQREFLANVSHELRTPLARIRVALDIAAEGNLDSARQAIAEIAHDWGDLDRLVEGVLTVARFDLSRDPSLPAVALQWAPIDAQALADRTATTFRELYADHSLEVEVEPGLVLEADAAMLRRVLGNLLTNAGKYSDAGTVVELAIESHGDEVQFRVSDRGMGIDPADLPRLFEPFFRADRSRARKTGGVGLGLAVAKRIVEAHGGSITVESRTVGSRAGDGTTVAFVIPKSRAS